MVKDLYLEKEEFNVTNECATPTMKLKRPQLKKRFQQIIDRMYAHLNETIKSKL